MSGVRVELPDVGEGLSEAEIVAWRVAVGEQVARDQVLLEVETDKSIVELPSPVDGVVAELFGEPGAAVPVGSLLAVINPTRVAETAETAETTQTAEAAETPALSAPPPPAPPHTAARTGRVLAAPSTRALAVRLGVDLGAVDGSGPGGRVTREDVTNAAGQGPAAASAPGGHPTGQAAPLLTAQPALAARTEPLRGVRRRVAQTMTAAWRDVPHITEFREVDATGLVAALAALRPQAQSAGVRLSYLPLLLRASALALCRHEVFNASLDLGAETITYHGAVNIGVATSTPDGLIVPVLRDADRRGLFDVAREVDRLAGEARARRLGPSDTRGGTFTVSNMGSYGAGFGTPIIRPPEAAIAAFGRIADRVVAVGGRPEVRPVLPVSVAADHRLVDGEDLGTFVNELVALLSDPILLLGQ